MRVLVTGSEGYIGRRLVPALVAASHEVTGLDTDWYMGCDFGSPPVLEALLRRDVRDLSGSDLVGFDAVCHLAAISNDPVGDLNPDITYEINYRASVRLAEAAKAAGVQRFLFSSSCSLYGASDGDEELDEEAPFNPVTPYGESKILTEQDLSHLADPSFAPVYLRNATVYGGSSRLRSDLVVNNLVGYALTTGEVRMTSDGSPSRPLVHVDDVAAAFVALLEAPVERIRDQAFNIGRPGENYRVREVAALVGQAVPGSTITFGTEAGPDRRDYRVSFQKIAAAVPEFRPQWTLEAGIRQLVEEYRAEGVTLEDIRGERFNRLAAIKAHVLAGRLDDSLRWTEAG